MKVLLIVGSPNKNGSSSFIADLLTDRINKKHTYTKIFVSDYKIAGCDACLFCKKNKECHIDDDMQKIYPLLADADIIIFCAPVYFYGFPSCAKALIDRCQAFWVQKLQKSKNHKKGVLIAVGGSSGERLFDGMILSSRYFFDALSAKLSNSLFYRKIEKKEDLKKVSNLHKDIQGLITSIGLE